MEWYLDVLKKYAVFEGRARRKEYWYFVLFNFLISIGLAIIDFMIMSAISGGGKDDMRGLSPLRILYSLAVLVPSIAVSVRRLHDTGRSGWWYLIGFIPCVGGILLLIWFATEGDAGRNAYGPDPLAKERRRRDHDWDDEFDEDLRRRDQHRESDEESDERIQERRPGVGMEIDERIQKGPPDDDKEKDERIQKRPPDDDLR